VLDQRTGKDSVIGTATVSLAELLEASSSSAGRWCKLGFKKKKKVKVCLCACVCGGGHPCPHTQTGFSSCLPGGTCRTLGSSCWERT